MEETISSNQYFQIGFFRILFLFHLLNEPVSSVWKKLKDAKIFSENICLIHTCHI